MQTIQQYQMRRNDNVFYKLFVDVEINVDLTSSFRNVFI